jgi:plastocyanin
MLRRAVPALVLLAACSKPAETPPAEPTAAAPQVITYTASDFAFTGPDTIAPGMTTIQLVNDGKQEHHLVLGQLSEGTTLDAVMAEMQANPNGEPKGIVWVGGAGGAVPTGTSGATNDLTPGRYVAFCFLPDPTDGGKPHIMKGMLKEIVVAGTPNGAPAPTADVEIHLSDFAFSPTTLTAGTHTIKVVNDGKQTHEIALARLDEGATAEAFLAALAPGAKAPPPGQPAGGNGAISPGKANYLTVTLTKGTYLLLCFVPDTADGKPHVMKGMVQTVVVN